jgi:hypothetical protein
MHKSEKENREELCPKIYIVEYFSYVSIIFHICVLFSHGTPLDSSDSASFQFSAPARTERKTALPPSGWPWSGDVQSSKTTPENMFLMMIMMMMSC